MAKETFNFEHFFTSLDYAAILQASLIVLVGYVTARVVKKLLTKTLQPRLSTHQLMLLNRLSFYLIFVLFLITALQTMGFNLGIIMGAAGIFTVAIGFASQTSASNLISGLFLILEKPFELEDLIQIKNTKGYVISIDLLSVKLKTLDNVFVRIPNETLIKSEIINFTRFSTRRFDMKVRVAYKNDLEKVEKTLFELAEKNNFCLKDPAPTFLGFSFALE